MHTISSNHLYQMHINLRWQAIAGKTKLLSEGNFGHYSLTLTNYTHTHTHPFNGPLSGTTQVSQYQKGKTNLDFTEARDSGIRWAICNSALRSRQITTPEPHRSVFYRLDALPAAQPTVSKHWRQLINFSKITYLHWTYNYVITSCYCYLLIIMTLSMHWHHIYKYHIYIYLFTY